jgi:hypothetical protein
MRLWVSNFKRLQLNFFSMLLTAQHKFDEIVEETSLPLVGELFDDVSMLIHIMHSRRPKTSRRTTH